MANKKFTPIFSGYVEDGKLAIRDQKFFDIWVEGLKGEVEITVKERKKIRSLGQNALYWGVFMPLILDDAGEINTEQNRNRYHDVFKEKFIDATEYTLYGVTMKEYKTTTDMSPMEFSDFIKNIEELTSVLCPDQDKISVK